MVWRDIEPVSFITDFADQIYHVDCKDTRMRVGNVLDRLHGAPEALAYLRRLDFPPATASFDAAFKQD
jgi:hypothetical protein